MQERERLWLVHPKPAVVNRGSVMTPCRIDLPLALAVLEKGVRRAIMAARSRSR
jgi:hypothetical protein